jgi:hypothetical protein
LDLPGAPQPRAALFANRQQRQSFRRRQGQLFPVITPVHCPAVAWIIQRLETINVEHSGRLDRLA